MKDVFHLCRPSDLIFRPVSVAEVGQKGFDCYQVAQDGKTILEITLYDFETINCMFLPKIYTW